MSEVKDPADVCLALAPLGDEERLRILGRWLVGDPTPSEQLLAEWDRLRLEERWPHPERLAVAMRLAGDIETCTQLLRGEPVDPDRVDKGELRKAHERRLVSLDLRAIDLLTKPEAA